MAKTIDFSSHFSRFLGDRKQGGAEVERHFCELVPLSLWHVLEHKSRKY